MSLHYFLSFYLPTKTSEQTERGRETMNRLYVTYRHKIYVHTREQMGSFYPTDITRRHKERERKGTIFFVLSTDNGRWEESRKKKDLLDIHFFIFIYSSSYYCRFDWQEEEERDEQIEAFVRLFINTFQRYFKRNLCKKKKKNIREVFFSLLLV